MIGPMGNTTVQTLLLCDELGNHAPGQRCKGWAVQGGIEVRCTNPLHLERLVLVRDACADAGCTHRQFDHWSTCGYLGTDARPGTGRHRRVTEHEASILRLMTQLVQGGIEPPRAGQLARNLWHGERAHLTKSLEVTWRDQEAL